MCVDLIMWIILIIWIICIVDGKTFNECRLVLHSLAVAVCQLYLALLNLRRAMRQFGECVRQTIVGILVERRLTNIAGHFFEGLCLFGEFITHLLSVASTLFVCLQHVLQGALFFMLSPVRWALNFKDKNEERQREAMQKEEELVEDLLAEYCQDVTTSVKRRRSQGEKTGQ